MSVSVIERAMCTTYFVSFTHTGIIVHVLPACTYTYSYLLQSSPLLVILSTELTHRHNRSYIADGTVLKEGESSTFMDFRFSDRSRKKCRRMHTKGVLIDDAYFPRDRFP